MIRESTPEELEQQLADARTEFFNLKVQQSIGRLEKPSRLRDVRRAIARLYTVKREKQPAKG
ncbi:MAG TPA: 50S ribosomal protein L29 [Kiritimatiellia bacterium]|nr:50S ribosomal protein L29 [Kiritimatiellia bacterium]HMP96222.1 50S ribosomal protein L29 [Kiritimatiellia bacterium]